MIELAPEWVGYFVVGVGAALVGSFVTMAVARFHTGMTWGGRSRCMACRAQLGVVDLVPILSCLFSRARCRHCGAGYGWWHMITEMVVVIIALALWHVYGFDFAFFIFFAMAATLVFVSLYDIRHLIIPDKALMVLFGLSAVGVVAGVLPSLGSPLAVFSHTFLDPIVALIAIPLPFLVMWIASRGRLMGFGDIKLMAWMGVTLGIVIGVEALVLAFWTGGLVGVGVIGARQFVRWGAITSSEWKQKLFAPQIPFGPFLAAGSILAVLGVKIIGILI